MNCTRCDNPIKRGQPYGRTKRGAHHFKCAQLMVGDALDHSEGDIAPPTNPSQELSFVGDPENIAYICFGGKYYTAKHQECVEKLLTAYTEAENLRVRGLLQRQDDLWMGAICAECENGDRPYQLHGEWIHALSEGDVPCPAMPVFKTVQQLRGSAETEGEKAAPGLPQTAAEWHEFYTDKIRSHAWVTGVRAKDWGDGSFEDALTAYAEAYVVWHAEFANFHRSSQNQTVSGGVEGAHEGITADKSGSREPEKLNNAPFQHSEICLWWHRRPCNRNCFPNFRQSPSLSESGAESADSGKQNTADKSGPELLPTQIDTKAE